MGPFPIYCHYENDIRIGRILVNIWCVRDSFHQTWEPQKEILLANLHVLPTMGNICNGVVLSCKADFRPGPRHPQHLAIIVSIPDISPSFSPSPWLILNVLRSFRHSGSSPLSYWTSLSLDHWQRPHLHREYVVLGDRRRADQDVVFEAGGPEAVKSRPPRGFELSTKRERDELQCLTLLNENTVTTNLDFEAYLCKQMKSKFQ